MSLSKEVVIRMLVDSNSAQQAIKAAADAAEAWVPLIPLLRKLSLARQRDRSRVVTRRKQRGKW